MDPTYQQAMIQALMGQQAMAPGTYGQNASTPYGAAFMTGNQSMPAFMAAGQPQAGMGASSQQLQQPYTAYPNAAAAQSSAAQPMYATV
jgi:hypothetical protein